MIINHEKMKTLKNMNRAQIATSVTGFKKKKSLFWNNFIWFLFGFLFCGILIMWL